MPVSRAQYRGPEKVKVRGAAPPDPDEALALSHAATEGRVPEAVAAVVISAWIAKRAELSAGARLAENLAFDLGDSKLRGCVGAALPIIGANLDIPPGVPFFALSRDQAIDVFALGFQAVTEAAVAADEAPDFMPDPPASLRKIQSTGDAIPFGGDA